MAQGIFLQMSERGVTTRLESRVDYKVKALIDMIKIRLTRLAEKSMGSVKSQMPEYYRMFKKLVERPYMFDEKRSVLIDLNRMSVIKKGWTALSMFGFDEGLSDHCLDLVMNGNCASNLRCFEYLMRENATGYQLTHQLLYFIFFEHVRS